MSEEEKDRIKKYQRERYQKLIQYKNEVLQSKINFILLSIKMSLKFDEIKIDKKEFHKSKQPIDLNLVGIN